MEIPQDHAVAAEPTRDPLRSDVGVAYEGIDVAFDQQRDDYLTSLTWVAGLMATTPLAQFGLPTPCTEYDVRTLMGHLIGTAERGLGTAERRSTRDIPHVVTDVPDEGLSSAYEGLAKRIAHAWASLSGHDQVRAAWGECSAFDAAQGYTVETVTHGWDLAVATGRDSEAPDNIASRCLLVAESIGPQRLRGVMYAEPASPRPTASATDRLASLLGHQRPPRISAASPMVIRPSGSR